MKILAIGATGLIGPHVVRQLVEKGCDVAIFHRGTTEATLPESIGHIHGDRDELSKFQATLARFTPDVVLDIVAYTELQARQVAEVFSGLAGRIVALSSADVYRNYDGLRGKGAQAPDAVPLSEGAPLREQLFPYRGYSEFNFDHKDGYEKILVEQTVMRSPDLPGTILRLPAVYGPGDRQHRFFSYLKRMDDRRPFILVEQGQAGWRWTHGYVKNVAAAIVLAVMDKRAAGRIYNVGEKETPTFADRIRRLGDVAGWTGEIISLPIERLPKHLHSGLDWRFQLVTDTRRIREELGYLEPIPNHESLRRTIEWERANPPGGINDDQFDYAAEDAAKDAA